MPKNFDRVAAAYPLLERLSFGDELNRARRAALEHAAAAEHILLVGEGNGRFLSECLSCRNRGKVTVVDLSAKMINSARRKAAAHLERGDVEFVQADFLKWEAAPEAFDLICTHFFLDLFCPPSQRLVIENIGRCAQAGALWIDVDYRCPRVGRAARLIDWLQYRFDRAFCGVEADQHYDPSGLIAEAGWTLDEEEPFARGNVVSRTYRRRERSQRASA
ncbi:MAG: class I SAM-dependent methyltransferase [Verrucomicrobia bacterium]|nr:class I SAM-dependent methyltransferase [Verrucomicrobiota bacterium]